ncbi:hypothetical protein DSC45_17465 [Streptomyces sp. YIM 130001]|uniref:hypothetical protein n=1 Tax=Streptomyces sp. YIM 130001 TaxID=2259644 RepID=UPI000EEB403A|nr:hypothetical protein [Streptomyces sp. YIM 130001]RII15620.1 hypothetical protein DSC45_17465 [Streptomyces sp. YIM 130001]
MSAASLPLLTSAGPPPVRGGLGLSQGRYGERGNLELVLCDEDDGLWVLWHNTDPEHTRTPPGSPPPGEWSGGLHFAGGHRYDDVRVLQSRNGPDHLEVLAHSGGTAKRLRWSPDAAFTAEEPPPGSPALGLSLAETTDGALWTVLSPAPGDRPRLHQADPAAYPRLTWTAGDTCAPAAADGRDVREVLLVAGPGALRPCVLEVSPKGSRWTDPAGRASALPGAVRAAAVHAAHGFLAFLSDGEAGLLAVRPGEYRPRTLPLPGSGPVTALAATPVRHDPRRTDLVIRRGGALWHLTDRGPGTDLVSRRVISRLRSSADGSAPVHRR